MANDLQLKRSSVSGRVPDAANVLVGEPVVNLADKIIYTKDGSGSVIVIGAGSTSNISEGTNLYYTDNRARSAISVIGGGSYDSATGVITITGQEFGGVLTVNGANGTVTLTTSNISESTNLYFTNTRAREAITVSGNGSYDAANGIITINSTDLSSYATTSYVNSEIANVISAAPAALDTLKELASAISDDPNFAGNIASSIGTKASNSYVQAELNLKANVADLNSSNVIEGNNLYFTNSRVRSSISVSGNGSYDVANGIITINSTDLSSYATVSYVSSEVGNLELLIGSKASNTYVQNQLNVKANIADLTTSNISEGTNLYFTTTRANSVIDDRVSKTFVDNLGIDAATLDGIDSSAFALDSDLTTANVSELTNLYFTNARVYANVVELGYATTSYVDNSIANVIGSAPAVLDTLKELADAVNNDPGFYSNVAIAGSTAFNQANAAYARANVAIESLTTANVVELNNLYFTNSRVYANVVELGYATSSNVTSGLDLKANVSDLTTSNVVEGSNLYFTNARVWANVTSAFDLKANISDLNTSNVTEGSNLYYTDSRANTAIDNRVTKSFVDSLGINATTLDGIDSSAFALDSDLTTANVSELNNLYFTETRARNSISVVGSGSYDAANGIITVTGGVTSVNGSNGTVILTTSNISEDTNLYFTNARARNAITVSGNGSFDAANGIITINSTDLSNYATLTNVSEAVANLVSSAPSTLDTLYELAAALNNDNNFASNVTTLIGTKASNTFVQTQFGNKANISDLTTANVTETTNLYYTDARVQDKLANVSGNIIPDTDVIFSLGSPTKRFKDLYLSGQTLYVGNTALTLSGSGGFSVIDDQGNLQELKASTLRIGGLTDLDNANSFVLRKNISDKFEVVDNTGNLVSFSQTTTHINEGSNLYFSNTRADARVEYYISQGKIAGAGYSNSSMGMFPTGDYRGDEINFTLPFDAFGQLLVPTFDLMDPVGRIETVDLGTI